MGKATYKLAFKGIHYAEVSVSAEMQAANGSISVSATAFAWLKDAYGPDAFEWAICDAYQTAAVMERNTPLTTFRVRNQD